MESEEYCYLTTTGRRSRRPHEIEIWFASEGSTLYMLAGDGRQADWVRNLIAQPSVRIRIGDEEAAGVARVVTDEEEDALARRLVVEKYQPGYGEDLSSWRETALPVAVDLLDRIRLHHIQLAMPNGGEDEAVAFYSGILGLKRIPKPEHLEQRGGVWFSVGDGHQLHLGVEEPFVPAKKAHPAFEIASLDAIRLALEATGAEVVLDEPLEGFDRFYTSDPFGNRIEILSRST